MDRIVGSESFWGKSVMRHKVFLACAALVTCTASAPAFATACSLTDVTPTAIACSGGYTGNVLDSSGPDVTTQQTALAALGFTWDGMHFDDFEKLSPLNGATTIDFSTLLHGTTIVGIHVGGGRGGGQTTFYKFDAGAVLDTFSIHLPSSSAAVLYSTQDATSPAPEPASWALMLGGFGLVGSAMRRRRSHFSVA